ncbi:hypothetical protein GCM10007049_10810 [Echinicola pacifica]|uniref:Uncharacterized protein n=1 Tax=Echinicola pacifica TaxID=346377 RepID=A0A918PRM9_9BACT|nr:hypothetical protein [Echinicola pacifica]GGZ20098.1 hypothetical protein GCM10007049_10810 [Echinicola pacifica]
MKKLSLKKWLVLSSALLLAGYAIVKACSDIYFYPNSNFTPEAFVEEDYRPLLLSSDFFYTGYDDIHNERFNESIVSQWSDYLGHNVDKQLIDSVLFRADSSLMVSWKSNFEAFPIQSPKAKAANMLDFMLIAKQVETASVNHQIYYWQERDVIRLEEEVLFEQIEKRFRTADHSFMKQRYWFQLIKAYFYSADKQGEIEPFFAATKDQMPKDDLYYQAMSYLAGAYYKQRDFVQSNVLYAEVFDQCTPLRKVALYSYHPQELEVFLQETLPQAKDNELLCALWALQGYYTEELPAIEAIHAIQADSPHLSYLLSRLINKQEWNIQAVNKEESFAENKTSPYTQVDKSMLPIIQKIADAEDTEKPEMWYLALGYMYMMDGQYQKSQDIYQAVSPDLLSSPLAKSQLRLLKLLTSLHMLTGESDEEIERLSEDLRWLYFDLPNETAEGMQDFRYELAFDWSQDFLSTYYKSKNNPIMEELFKGYEAIPAITKMIMAIIM